MSAGTMTASWGVQGEATRARSPTGAPLNSSMGVLEADIDGGIFNDEVIEHRGAHLHRRGLLRPSRVTPFPPLRAWWA